MAVSNNLLDQLMVNVLGYADSIDARKSAQLSLRIVTELRLDQGQTPAYAAALAAVLYELLRRASLIIFYAGTMDRGLDDLNEGRRIVVEQFVASQANLAASWLAQLDGRDPIDCYNQLMADLDAHESAANRYLLTMPS